MERTSLFFYKLSLLFLTWISKVLTEGFLHIGPCFDAVFAQLKVIPKTRNKFVENVDVTDRYLIITHVKNKRSKKQPLRICLSVIPYIIYLSWWKNISKKRKKLFVPSLQYCQFGQDGWKSRTFFMKISWRWTCSQIFRKFSYWEDLSFWMMLNTAFADL